MRRDIWHLHPVDVIVSADHMIKTVLPMHCNKWHSIIIVKQESTISIYGFLHFRCISILDDCLKHLCHILCNRQYSCSCIRFCGFYDISHIRCSLQLVVNIYSSVLKINVFQRQSTKFCFCQYKSKKNLLLIRKKHHCFHPVMLLRTILFRLCFFFFVENVIHLPAYLHTTWFINKDFLNNL